MNEKLVEFDVYCKTCKHCKVPETEDPCNECLTTAARSYSHKPLNYSEDKTLLYEDDQKWRSGKT